MGVLAAGVGEMDADMRLEGALVRREPGVAIYPEERAACRARVGDEMGAEPVQVRPEAADEQQRGVADRPLQYRTLFLANQSRLLWRLSWRRNSKRSGLKNASLGTGGTSSLSHCRPARPSKLAGRGEQRKVD